MVSGTSEHPVKFAPASIDRILSKGQIVIDALGKSGSDDK